MNAFKSFLSAADEFGPVALGMATIGFAFYCMFKMISFMHVAATVYGAQ